MLLAVSVSHAPSYVTRGLLLSALDRHGLVTPSRLRATRAECRSVTISDDDGYAAAIGAVPFSESKPVDRVNCHLAEPPAESAGGPPHRDRRVRAAEISGMHQWCGSGRPRPNGLQRRHRGRDLRCALGCGKPVARRGSAHQAADEPSVMSRLVRGLRHLPRSLRCQAIRSHRAWQQVHQCL